MDWPVEKSALSFLKDFAGIQSPVASVGAPVGCSVNTGCSRSFDFLSSCLVNASFVFFVLYCQIFGHFYISQLAGPVLSFH